MIDVHCHMLPFLDDGAPDWDASIAMARAAVGDGITQCIFTPHWTGTDGEAARALNLAEEFRARTAEEAIHLRVHSGNEVILVPRLEDSLKSGQALTLGESSYVLLETAQLEQGAYIHSALFQLQSQGYRVVLAHPERVTTWQSDARDLHQLLWRGCYLQINAGSLLGDFGPAARRAAERFLRLGWVSLLATDAHSPDSRPPLLREALERCSRIIGHAAAAELVDDNPARILCDDLLPPIDPDPPSLRGLARLQQWLRR